MKSKIWNVSLAVIATFLLTGCSGIIAAKNYQEMTPAQIKSLKDIGSEVIACTMVGGPPVGGRTTFLVLPKTAKGTVKLTPDCQIQETTVTLGKAP